MKPLFKQNYRSAGTLVKTRTSQFRLRQLLKQFRNLQSPHAQPMYKGGVAFGRTGVSLLSAATVSNKEANCSKALKPIFSCEKEWTIIAA
jgi:hypothetical protein